MLLLLLVFLEQQRQKSQCTAREDTSMYPENAFPGPALKSSHFPADLRVPELHGAGDVSSESADAQLHVLKSAFLSTLPTRPSKTHIRPCTTMQTALCIFYPPAHGEVKPNLQLAFVGKYTNAEAEVEKKKRTFMEKEKSQTQQYTRERKGKGRHTWAGVAASIFTAFAHLTHYQKKKFALVSGSSRSASKSFPRVTQQTCNPHTCAITALAVHPRQKNNSSFCWEKRKDNGYLESAPDKLSG